MIERYTEGKLTWVDAENPTAEEVRALFEEFGLPPTAVEDLSARGSRPSAHYFEKDAVLKVILHFPVVKRTDITYPHELTFLLTKDALITVRYEDMESIHRFKKEFEVLTALHKETPKRDINSSHLFLALLRELYRALSAKLDYIESKLGDIEDGIFANNEKTMVYEISNISRRLITFRQTIAAHDEVLQTEMTLLDTYFGTNVVDTFRKDIYVHYLALEDRLHGLSETLEELRNTNFALLTTKQNEIMKILTIMAFITFPLSLFTSMFGMNTRHTPILGIPGDFWIIVGMMSVITVSFFAFFKYKRWI